VRELAIVAVLFSLAAAACGGSSSSCPTEVPPCPSPAPSFVAEVNPIIQTTCVPCHGPGGVEANRPYVTYEDMKVHGPFVTMYSQVLGCRMPEPPQQLTSSQRQRLLEWFACGEPDDRAASVDGGTDH
jgi:hypothetical protein